MAKIKDVIFEYSVRNKANENINVYSVTNDKGFCTDYFSKEVASKDKTTYKIVPRGYFAYNPSRINVGSIDWQNHEDRVIVSPLYVVFGVSKHIDQQYLLYYLKSDIMLSLIKESATGSVRDNLKLSTLEEFPINLRPIDEQRHIAAVLDKVSDLIAKRRQQLDKLDELVKSRFIEMFGDPVTNTFGWKQALLCGVTSKIGSGATPKGGKESYQTEGITLIRSMNVHDGRFEYKDLAHITDEQAAQLDNVTVEDGDVFINITGASVARSCVVPKDTLPARVNQHVAIVRCIRAWLHPIFANNMFLNDRFKRQLLDIGESGGATRQAITKQQLENLTVILPPLELQEQFVAFVAQTDKVKLTIQRSSDKLEVLKNTLMQKYFE